MADPHRDDAGRGPFDSGERQLSRDGRLKVTDGNAIYWQETGTEGAPPILLLHGGPGSGNAEKLAMHLDPDQWRIIALHQRGCGHSTPHASATEYDFAANTTAHLIADIEVLRAHFEIDRWALFGLSWGTTLALAYAQQYAERVTGLLLTGVTTTRRSEIDWLVYGLRQFFPAQWQVFRNNVAEADEADLIAGYAARLSDPDPEIAYKAAQDWHDWEAAARLISAVPQRTPRANARQLARARIITHFFRNNAWLEDNQLIGNAHKLIGIPGELVQSQLDLEAPAITAYELAAQWPDALLTLVDGGAHDPTGTQMQAALSAAARRLRRRIGDSLVAAES